MKEDAELLSQYVRDGSQLAFAELVQRHFTLVYSAALRRSGNDHQRAVEITQQVFISLSRRAQTVLGHPMLAGWLYTATRNAAIDLRRAEARRRAWEQAAFIMQQLNAPTDREVKWDQLRVGLDQVIDDLSERDRTALVLRYFEGLSYPEVAAKLSIATDTARMRVDRALDKLRRLLERRGLTTASSAALSLALTQNAISAPSAALIANVTSQAMLQGPALSILTAINLMISTKIAAGLGGVTVAVLLGLTWHETRVANEHTLQLASVAQEYSADLQSYRTEQQARTVAAGQRQTGTRVGAVAEPTAAAQQAALARGAMFQTSLANGRELEAKNPGLKELIARGAAADVDAMYHQLYSSLHLSAIQIEQFRAIMAGEVTRSFSGPDGMAYAFGDLPGSESGDNRAAQLQALLGQSGYDQYREFHQNVELGHAVTDQFAIAAAASSNPLSEQQIAALDPLFNVPFLGPGTWTRADRLAPIDWAKVSSQAATILNPQQLATFTGVSRQIQVNMAVIAAARSVEGASP